VGVAFKVTLTLYMPKVKLFNETEALENAKTIFWQKGFNATSMQDLVDSMQISRQSLYDTYGNKETLFLQCLNKYQQESNNSVCQNLAYNGNLKQTLLQFFNAVVNDIINDKTQKGCFMLNTLIEVVPENKAAKTIVKKNYDKLEKDFVQLFNTAKQIEKYSSTFTPNELATHFITLLHGMRLVGKIKKEKEALQKMVQMGMLVIKFS
jgi:TetR/AcrR family transcriptional regulator, transcriptional repressor for nem operon